MIHFESEGMTLLLEYEKDDTLSVKGCEGFGSRIVVPEKINDNGKEVYITSIQRKAFMGSRGIREVILPGSIEKIGDWAFSQCIHLTRFSVLGEKVPTLEKGVFAGDERLEYIKIGPDDDNALPVLMSLSVSKLPADYLLSDSAPGSSSWYEKLDLAITSFLNSSDLEGITNRVLCGEEDISYDGIGSVDGELLGENASFLKETGKNKCNICIQRLLHDKYLSEETREALSVYITERSVGKKPDYAWLLMKECYKDNLDMFKLFLDIVKPFDEDVDLMLSQMGEDMAQAKAFLIKSGNSQKKEEAFFDGLSL